MKTKDGKEFEASDSDFSNWKISLSYQGKDLQSESDKKITVQENLPEGIYTFAVSAMLKGIYYENSLTLKISE